MNAVAMGSTAPLAAGAEGVCDKAEKSGSQLHNNTT